MFGKDIIGVVAVGITSTGYINYIISVLRGKTRPHAFTWITWSLIMGMMFYAQWSKGAGAGAWTTGVSDLFCVLVAILSLFRGEKYITKKDCFAFASALLIIPFWYVTKNATWAVVFATLIDGFAYYPTFHKAWRKPGEEDFILYISDITKWCCAFLAMATYSMITLFYPCFCILANASLATMIITRRRKHTNAALAE